MGTLINTILLNYFGFFAIYLFLFAVASKFPVARIRKKARNKQHSFAVFIPAYKEDTVLISSVRSAINQTYSAELYDVIVIADHVQPHTIEMLKKMSVTVLEVESAPRTKARALNFALDRLDSIKYDACVVLDVDNIIEPGFLSSMNDSLNEGWKAIQCRRVAKNTNTPIAVLDAVSEDISNSILRKGHRALGFSSGLSGSGMVFDYETFKQVMRTITATNGFDKDLEFALFRNKIEIEYRGDIKVYDEKVQSAEVLQKQRTRWFAAQWKNIAKGYRSLRTAFSTDGFDKWLQMIMLPRVFMLCALGAGTFVTALTGDVILFSQWLLITLLFVGSLFIGIPSEYYTRELLRAVAYFPSAIKALFGALFDIRKANGGFIHTPHTA
jgi:cellulose synthase/poly-beta-1,6-N-acetylglucosamine synthase-like glycosyltransferase